MFCLFVLFPKKYQNSLQAKTELFFSVAHRGIVLPLHPLAYGESWIPPDSLLSKNLTLFVSIAKIDQTI